MLGYNENVDRSISLRKTLSIFIFRPTFSNGSKRMGIKIVYKRLQWFLMAYTPNIMFAPPTTWGWRPPSVKSTVMSTINHSFIVIHFCLTGLLPVVDHKQGKSCSFDHVGYLHSKHMSLFCSFFLLKLTQSSMQSIS